MSPPADGRWTQGSLCHRRDYLKGLKAACAQCKAQILLSADSFSQSTFPMTQCPKVRWTNCKLCQKRIRDENLPDEYSLQSWFIGRINTFLMKCGKRLIGWDEILEGGLNPGTLVMSWRVRILCLLVFGEFKAACRPYYKMLVRSLSKLLVQASRSCDYSAIVMQAHALIKPPSWPPQRNQKPEKSANVCTGTYRLGACRALQEAWGRPRRATKSSWPLLATATLTIDNLSGIAFAWGIAPMFCI